jgi:hypothetical protein
MVAESLHAAINAQPHLQVIGWAIVHSLWQNSLIALGYAFLVRAIDESSAGFRHLIGCVALLLMLAMPLTTASLMYFSESVPR